ncbi:MAG: hypothetical protein KIT34_17070 [Cyanobacteria bacterium TGS_CYA1]|nr:hypothetical protein [Cyanobacteria bacterium TGS_CYA1]
MTETLIILGVCEVSCLAMAFLTWYLLKSRPKTIARRKALLEDSLERLKLISYELLRKVDDMDLAKKYAQDSDNHSSSPLKLISLDSALLSESLETIEHLLKKRKLDDANRILGASAKLAEKIQADLNDLDQNAIVLKIESKIKEKP